MPVPRLYPILDTECLQRRGCAVETAARAMLDGGVRILQFRHKGHFSREVFTAAQRVAAMCRDAGAIFVIDDRADMAMLLDAGLHVGQDDLAPGDARRLIGRERVLGFSTHNLDQLQAACAEPADYVAIGPIFGTGSKRNPDPVVGLELCREASTRVSRLQTRVSAPPVVAIGGITRENALSVLQAGADSVAVIADLVPEVCTYANLLARVAEWQQLLLKV